MSDLNRLYNGLLSRICWETGTPTPSQILRDLVDELRQAGVPLDDDAVTYTIALRIWGGTIGQLTFDLDDPGYVNRASGATEGFYPRDLCGSARRKQRGMATAVRAWEPVEFLARDSTGTLAQRAKAFEAALITLLRKKLAT